MIPFGLTSLLGKKPRRSKKQPKELRWPRSQELEYTAACVGVARQTAALLEQTLIPQLPRIVAEAHRNTPTPKRTDDTADTLTAIFDALYDALGLTDTKARGMAIEMLESVQRHHARTFTTVYSGILPINPLLGQEPWLLEQMRASVAENARLIQSIPTNLVSEVEGIVTREVLAGTRVEAIADLIRERYGVAENRAVLIAQDQVGKWFGSLSRHRQVDAGVSEYEWSTVGDGAVRPTHRANDGKIFSWDKPPARTGHPGHDVRCRCQAIAVIESVDESVDAPIEQPATIPSTAPNVPPTRPAPRAPSARPKPPAAPTPLPYGEPAPEAAVLRTEFDAYHDQAIATMERAPGRYVGELPAGMSDWARKVSDDVAKRLGLRPLRPITEMYAMPLEDITSFGVMDYDGRLGLKIGDKQRAEQMFETVVHETIHTMGGAGMAAYQGAALVFEEASTEELTRQFLGATWKSVPGAKLDLSEGANVNKAVAAWKDHPADFASVGTYETFRNRLMSVVSSAEGIDAEATAVKVRKAMARWKERAYPSHVEAERAFIDALEPATRNVRAFYEKTLLVSEDEWQNWVVPWRPD